MEDWNDAILKKISSEKKFPKEVMKTSEIKPIISRFFSFYFSGKVSENCTVQCTIYSAITLLNVKNSGGYLRVFYDEKFMTAGDEKSFYVTHRHTQQNCQENFKVTAQKSFENWIWNSLQSWHCAEIDEQKTLMRLTAFLALKLCLVASKTSQQMEAILDAKFHLRKNLEDVVGWELTRPYSAPNFDAIDKCKEELISDTSNNSPLKALFAIVVQTWIEDRITSKENKVSPLLMNSLLEDTAGNGIGLITMMTSVMFCMNVTFDEILNALKAETKLFPQYEEAWSRLTEFKKKFVDKARPELSYPWARLIRPTSLSEFSAKNNVLLCAIFAGVVEIYEGKQVWNAYWAKSNYFYSQEAKQIAVKIHERLKKRSENS